MRNFAWLAMVLASCTSSHTGDEDAGPGRCGGDPAPCHPIASISGSTTCCHEEELVPGCLDGAWVCVGDSTIECHGFLERGECEMPPIDWAACDIPSDCTITANSCCGTCGRPGIDDVDAVNVSATDEHYDDVCPVPEPCPDCPTALNPELIATCTTGRCEAIDLGGDDITACNTDTDCRIRVPDCCECGADTNAYRLIAIRADRLAAYSELVCDPEGGCPECEPVYPPEAIAACGADGHCEVIIAAP